METLRQHAQTLIDNLLEGLFLWTPRVLAGIAIVILVFVIAKILEWTIRSILKRTKFEKLLEKIGLRDNLQRIGILNPANFAARLVYFLFLFLVAQSVADILGLHSLSAGISSFIAYLPNLLGAVVILLAGSMAGQFVGKLVSNAAGESGIEFAPALGKVVSGLIVFVTGIMAIGQLKIDTDIIRIVTVCSLAALSLAFGLSFGLGTREITRNIIAGYYARKVFRMGEEIDVGGEKGLLRAITPTQTLLERDGQTVALSNAAFLDKVVRQ